VTNHDLIRQQARTIARQQQRIAELEAREAVLKDIIEKALRIREYTHVFFGSGSPHATASTIDFQIDGR
jgi:hypothetical protein